MWLPGHLAISFLTCTPLLVYARSQGEDKTLALSYVAFFAVLPDFLHIGDLRILSHSVTGLTVLVSAALIVLSLFVEVRRIHVLIASVAAGAHLLADWMFGHFFPLFPFSNEYASLNYFNTLIDLRAEIALTAVAIVVFAVLTFSGCSAWRCVWHTRRDRLGILLLLMPFLTLALLETAYFIQNMGIVGTTFTRLMMLALFAPPIGGTMIVIVDLLKCRASPT
jgi:hypothetical protein